MKDNQFWKEDKLKAESPIYGANPEIYEEFSQAEDKPNKIVDFLKPIMKNKVVLDLGCGTGKFIPDFALVTKSYFGIELMNSQLSIAERKVKDFSNVKLINGSAEEIPIESKTVDLVFASWVIGSIYDISLREKIIQEAHRVLNDNGEFYIIENDIGGDYKELVEEGFGDKKTKIKLDWLEENGFIKVKSIKTYFEFESLNSAKRIIETIWGKDIASKIKKNKISHNIVIYKNGKK